MNTIRILDVFSCWKVLCVVYRNAATASAENEIKIIPYSEDTAKYLCERLGAIADIRDLKNRGISWVDESEFYENGIKIQVKLEDEEVKSIDQFCCKHEVTSEKLVYGVSCFLCNPANGELVLCWLKDTFGDTQTKSDT